VQGPQTVAFSCTPALKAGTCSVARGAPSTPPPCCCAPAKRRGTCLQVRGVSARRKSCHASTQAVRRRLRARVRDRLAERDKRGKTVAPGAEHAGPVRAQEVRAGAHRRSSAPRRWRLSPSPRCLASPRLPQQWRLFGFPRNCLSQKQCNRTRSERFPKIFVVL
jgi:hypothetical protein